MFTAKAIAFENTGLARVGSVVIAMPAVKVLSAHEAAVTFINTNLSVGKCI